MKTKLILLALVSTFSLQPSALHAQGALTPPGAPAPTMKSLAQIEPRTPIASASFTIAVPGSYYLTTNITVASGTAITIATNGVTLDLNGFTISSTAASATGTGILLNGALRNITIANGLIQGGVTNNGSGVYSGSGFAYGIYYSVTLPVNVLVSRVSVSGCLDYGIFLSTGDSTVVESCAVRTVGGYGIYASTVKQSSAIDCGGSAIVGDQVSDCRGESSGSGTGVSASTAQNCYGSSDGGTGVSATTAQNCRGSSTSGNGVSASSVLNCYGVSNGSGNGVSATIAQNCYGMSVGSGYGIYSICTAIGCYGYSSSGTGLYAFIANVCHGETSTGTALTTTHNVNSY